MTLAHDILLDGFQRSHENVGHIVRGLSSEQLRWRPGPKANPIGWLVWHLTRQQDAQVSSLADREPVWTAAGFAEKFDLPYDRDASGYGQSADEVGRFSVDGPQLLQDYHEAVYAMTREVVEAMDDDRLAEVIDDSWDPPVTVVVRLVSVVDDAAQHAGQAAYVRGLLT